MLRRNTLKTLCEESQLANPINKTNRGHSYKKGNLFLWKTLLQLQKILHDDSHAINFSMLYIACSTPPYCSLHSQGYSYAPAFLACAAAIYSLDEDALTRSF